MVEHGNFIDFCDDNKDDDDHVYCHDFDNCECFKLYCTRSFAL